MSSSVEGEDLWRSWQIRSYDPVQLHNVCLHIKSDVMNFTWTMESKASIPSRWEPVGLTGTPTTGRGVIEATIPGKWAAPPAPAIITCTDSDFLGTGWPGSGAYSLWSIHCHVWGNITCTINNINQRSWEHIQNTTKVWWWLFQGSIHQIDTNVMTVASFGHEWGREGGLYTLRPLSWAVWAYDIMRCGVRCADTMVTSQWTPRDCSVVAAARMVGRSLSDPMMIPTSAVRPFDRSVGLRIFSKAYQIPNPAGKPILRLKLDVSRYSLIDQWPSLAIDRWPSLASNWWPSLAKHLHLRSLTAVWGDAMKCRGRILNTPESQGSNQEAGLQLARGWFFSLLCNAICRPFCSCGGKNPPLIAASLFCIVLARIFLPLTWIIAKLFLGEGFHNHR